MKTIQTTIQTTMQPLDYPTGASQTIRTSNLNRTRKGAISMNRFVKLLALAAVLSLPSTVLAQALPPTQSSTQYVTGSMNFQVSNKSMWAPDLPGGWVGYSYALNKSWNTNLSKEDYSGGFGGGVGINSNGTAGINLYAGVSAGNVNVNYNIQGGVGLPISARAGRPFTITSGWAGLGGTLSTQSPQFGIQVESSIEGSASAHLKAKAFDATIFDENPSQDMRWQRTLVDLNNGSLSASIDVQQLGILKGNAHTPMINTNGNGFDKTLTASGQDTFLTLTGDITQFMTTVLGLPSFKGSDTKGWGDHASYSYSYNFLDLYGTLSLTARQDFSFTATPKATLTFRCGNQAPYVVTVPLGTNPQVTLPASFTGPVSVETSISIADNTFNNNTKLIVNPGLYFLPISASAGVNMAGDYHGVNFTPIQPIPLVTASFPTTVYSKSFALQGFQPKVLRTVTINVTTP